MATLGTEERVVIVQRWRLWRGGGCGEVAVIGGLTVLCDWVSELVLGVEW